MKLSKNWLKDYLNLDKITDEELQNIIGFHVCEIEAYKKNGGGNKFIYR